jgi:hypothetical protein
MNRPHNLQCVSCEAFGRSSLWMRTMQQLMADMKASCGRPQAAQINDSLCLLIGIGINLVKTGRCE